MKHIEVKMIAVCVAAAASMWAFDTVEEKEKIDRSFAGTRTLEIDNVYGSIRVTGYSGSEARVHIDKTIKADDAERLAAAKREVKLDITDADGGVRLYEDGPFRCHCDEGERGRNNVHENRRRGYQVIFDYEVKVPAGAKLLLSTVNGGEIVVGNTSGDYEVDNINGGVEMNEVAGSGRVYALNGKVKVVFARNPAKNSSFGSLNGPVDISFRPDLSADLRFKTFNGSVFTDFPVSALPTTAGTGERKNGKFVYRSNDFAAARVGAGGPEYKFDAFNGNIRIINRGQ
jgi:hypothetical protein